MKVKEGKMITVEKVFSQWYVLRDTIIVKRPYSITDAFKTKKEAQKFADSLQK